MGGPELIAAQAVMQIVGGIGERSQLRGQARAVNENARVTETQGGYDALDALRESRAEMGEQLAGAAASGNMLSGSVSDLLVAQARENQLAAMTIRANAGLKADGMRQEAKQLKKQGDLALLKSTMSAGATAIGQMSRDRADSRVGAAVARDGVSRRRQGMGAIPIPGGGASRTGPLYEAG